MAQQGAGFFDRLKKIRLERTPYPKRDSTMEGTPRREGTSAQVPLVDLVPPKMTENKNKRKDRSKKHSSPRYSPKRSRPTSSEVRVSSVNQLFAPDLSFFKGMNFSLSPAERGVMNLSSTDELAAACVEMQSRALVFAKTMRAEIAKGYAIEILKLKKELATSANSLKVVLDANSVQADKLKKVESERNSLRMKCEELTKEKEKLFSDLTGFEQNLGEATLAHDKAVSEKVQMELELIELKDYVLTVHSEGFNQAVRQAILLYGVPVENELDSGKDVYSGRLVSIDDISSVAIEAPPTTTILYEEGPGS